MKLGIHSLKSSWDGLMYNLGSSRRYLCKINHNPDPTALCCADNVQLDNGISIRVNDIGFVLYAR